MSGYLEFFKEMILFPNPSPWAASAGKEARPNIRFLSDFKERPVCRVMQIRAETRCKPLEFSQGWTSLYGDPKN
jgi:hypothetical protein